MALVTGYYAELSQRGVLLIRGPDTHKFLQGQTTCDVDGLTAERALNGAHCTPQGRMVCDFRLLGCGEDSWLMCMHRGICESSAASFGKYIVFSKADIHNASEQWRSFAVWGEDLADTLGQRGGQRDRVCEQYGAWWVQTDDAGERLECHVPTATAATLVETLAGMYQPGAEQAWQLAEINAGQGHLEPETVEMFIPQMLNYQLTGHISFSKGCYTGQEVVARMHYRGKLKRPMYLASINPAPDAEWTAAGTPLYRAGSEQSIGNVVNCCRDGNAYRLLAVVTSAAIAGGVHLADPAGPQLSFHDLPYTLPGD